MIMECTCKTHIVGDKITKISTCDDCHKKELEKLNLLNKILKTSNAIVETFKKPLPQYKKECDNCKKENHYNGAVSISDAFKDCEQCVYNKGVRVRGCDSCNFTYKLNILIEKYKVVILEKRIKDSWLHKDFLTLIDNYFR